MNEFQAKRMNDGDKLSIASKAICERKVQWCHPEWWLPEAWSTRISSTRRTGRVWEAIFWIYEHYFQVHGPTWLFPSIENPGWKSWLQSFWCRALLLWSKRTGTSKGVHTGWCCTCNSSSVQLPVATLTVRTTACEQRSYDLSCERGFSKMIIVRNVK